MKKETRAWLEGRHTRALLALLKRARRFHPMAMDLSDNHEGNYVTVDEIKGILATREHIPNKQEAKVARQAKAKAQKNKGRRDRG